MDSKVIQWSYSSMNNFSGCPLRYYEVEVLKKHPFKDTDATRYGKAVHSAIEDYINDGVCLPDSYNFAGTVKKVALLDGEKHCELRMGVLRDGATCQFKDENAWVRGIADLIVVTNDGKRAIIIDWKTGGDRYPDVKQLELMFLLLKAKRPEIEQFDCYLFFLTRGTRVFQRYLVKDVAGCWGYWESKYEALSTAFVKEHFPPKKSALCGWCPVSTCKHQKSRP